MNDPNLTEAVWMMHATLETLVPQDLSHPGRAQLNGALAALKRYAEIAKLAEDTP